MPIRSCDWGPKGYDERYSGAKARSRPERERAAKLAKLKAARKGPPAAKAKR